MKALTIILSTILFTGVAPAFSQSFEGIVKMKTTNAAQNETAIVTWYVKGNNHKMVFDANVNDTAYSYTLLLDNTGGATMLTEQQGEKYRYDVPANEFTNKQNAIAGVRLVKKGETTEVANHECRQYVFEGNGTTVTACIADNEALSTVGLPISIKASGIFQALRNNNITGFPLQFVVTDASGETITSQTVLSVEPLSIPDDAFKIPEGYKRLGE